MHSKAKVVFCLLVLLMALHSRVAYCAPSSLRVTADSALLMDWHTGTVLYEKNAYALRHPASLTKIMTAVVALENSSLHDVITVTEASCYIPGQTVNLRPGQRFTMEDLLYATLLKSANDAATAVAVHVGGSVPEFASMMNQKAAEIGTLSTCFMNPHGHTQPGHLTTAYDLAQITRYAMGIPHFATCVSTMEAEVDRLDKDVVIRLRNTNQLLWHFEGADGVKTGTTQAAGKSLIASATRGEQKLICVVLHSDSRWQDAEALLDYGFSQYGLVLAYRQGELVRSVRVTNGMAIRVSLVCDTDLAAVVPIQYLERVYVSEPPTSVNAPCDPLVSVGSIGLWLDDKELARAQLMPRQYVPRRTLWRLLRANFARLTAKLERSQVED